MTRDLDSIARRAADDLRAGLADVPVPDRPARSPLPGVGVAVVAVLALLVGSLAVLRSDERTPVTAEGGVPRLVARDLPDGLELSGGGDLPAPAEEGFTLDLWVYGTDDLDPELSVSSVPRDPTVTTTAAIEDANPYREEDGLRTLLVERPGARVGLASRVLDRAGLEAAAAQLAFDDDGQPTGELEGLPLLAAQQDAVFGTVPLLTVPRGTEGHVTGYQDEGTDRQLAVATFAGGPDLLATITIAQAPKQIEAVEVRGHPGRHATFAGGLSAWVWQESPGVVAAIVTTLPAEDVAAAAASLEPATDDEWRSILALAEQDDDAGGVARPTSTTAVTLVPGDVLQAGRLRDGRRWKLLEQDHGRVCSEVIDADGRGSASTCLSAEEQGDAFVEVSPDRQGEPALLWGRCPPGTQGVRTPGRVTGQLPTCTWFALDVTDGVPDEVIFEGRDGQELARLPVDN